MHVFGWWKEARVSGEKPRMLLEDMENPNRKAPAGIQTRSPVL